MLCAYYHKQTLLLQVLFRNLLCSAVNEFELELEGFLRSDKVATEVFLGLVAVLLFFTRRSLLTDLLHYK